MGTISPSGRASRAETALSLACEPLTHGCKVLQNSFNIPSRTIFRRAIDNDTPGLVAPFAFCKFPDWGMSEMICNTIANFIGHASLAEEKNVSRVTRGSCLLCDGRDFLFRRDVCPKKFAILSRTISTEIEWNDLKWDETRRDTSACQESMAIV